MALSATARKQRSRAHARGEHSLCDPARCEGAAPAVTDVTAGDAAAPVTAGVTLAPLGDAGGRLWAALAVDDELAPPPPAELVLRTELCRAVDRSERLDALVRGDVGTWAQVRRDNGGDLVLRIDSAVGEARAHAGLIRGLVDALGRTTAPAAAPSATPPAQTGVGGTPGVTDIRTRVAQRRAAAADPDARAVQRDVRA